MHRPKMDSPYGTVNAVDFGAGPKPGNLVPIPSLGEGRHVVALEAEVADGLAQDHDVEHDVAPGKSLLVVGAKVPGTDVDLAHDLEGSGLLH